MKIRYNRTNVYSVAGLRLLPGLNIVDDQKWKSVADHVAVKSRIKMGAIVVEDGGEADDTEIMEMNDVEQLREIAKGHGKRPEVRAARERLAQIDSMQSESNDEAA